MAQPLRCPQCGKDAVLRSQCFSFRERILSVLLFCPFRCQLCSHRFLAFRWGRCYPTHLVDRREHTRIPVRFSLAFSGGRIRGDGTVLNISIGGCLIQSDAPAHADEIYHLKLFISEQELPIEEAAIVRSVRAKSIGLKFLRTARDNKRLLKFLRERAGEMESSQHA